jgi:hypothetical protein
MGSHTGIVYSGELLDWGFDWTDAIPSGDTIASSVWEVSGDAVALRDSTADGVAVVWVTNYEAGELYDLTNRVTLTPSQRIFDQTITLYCLDAGTGGGVEMAAGEWTDGDGMVWTDGDDWNFAELA